MIEQYSIEQLIGKFTLFVPEIQRDYVWGAKDNIANVMIPFLKTLDYNLKDDSKYNIGFLYSYKNSNIDNYIIDGQQRFTTIVLLLYVLSVQDSNKYSDFCTLLGVDKPTMHFSYNVRPQTETFLRRLFISKMITRRDISNQTWYMSEYDDDMSVMSMINAVDSICSILSDLHYITFDKILQQVYFWYFNVDETSQGEELYITMNSRGQKLTEAEQLKPYLFDQWQNNKQHSDDKHDYGKLWDDWEEIFYSQKRDQDISSVDIAMNTFLRVVYEMETEKECNDGVPVRNDVLSLHLIYRYMNAMLDYGQSEWPKLLSGDKSYRPQLLLKALIANGLKPRHIEQDTGRVLRVFTNIVTRRKYNIKHSELLVFLKSFSKSSSSLYDFILENPTLSSTVFDEHELIKIKIYKFFENQPQIQHQIELAFAENESMKVWRGNIKPLIEWSLSEDATISSFNFNVFRTYAKKFETLFADNLLTRDEMDVTRRALLAFGLHDYPRIFKGYTNTSFAYDAEDWHKLFLDEENIPKLKTFFDLYDNDESLLQLINNYNARDEYSDFVHIPELLKFCHQKRIQWWWGSIYLISETNANSAHANIHTYKYYLSRKESLIFDNWSRPEFYKWEKSCMCFNCNVHNIAIDILWNGGSKNNQMAIEVFMRVDNNESIEQFLMPLLSMEGYHWTGGRYAYYFDCPDEEYEAFSLMDQNIKAIIDFINSRFNH